MSIELLQKRLDDIVMEAKASRDDADARWSANLRFRKGEQWLLPGGKPKRSPSWQSQLTMNFADTMLRRSVGLLTDSKPTIEVQPIRPSDIDQRAADIFTKVVNALWDEQSWTQTFERALDMAGTMSMVGMSLPYDRTLDNGLGDIALNVEDPRSLLFDPAVIAPELLGRGEYVIKEWHMALELAKERYRLQGDLRPDDDISSFAVKESEPRRILGQAGRFLSPLKLGGGGRRVQSAIPRVWVQEFQLQDYTRHDPEAGSPYLFPRLANANIEVPPGERLYPTGRRIIRVGKSSKLIATDDRNPYWEGLYDTEIFNWNVMLDDALGSSEIESLRSAQMHVNQITSLMADNAASMQNGVWVGDANALTREEWNRLTNEPGLHVKKRPGTDLRREAGQALPTGVLEFVSFLIDGMRTLSGLTDATEGRSGTATSGVAIENLQIASQTIVRIRARQLESFMVRIFRRIVPRILQFMTRDRRLWITGPQGDFDSVDFIRNDLLDTLREGDPTKAMSERWRDFRFAITPGSSLGITTIQRIVLATDLFQLGLIDDEEVLRAAKWPNRENVQARVKQKKLEEIFAAQSGVPASANGAVSVENPGGKRGTPAASPAGTLGGPAGAAFDR